MTNITALQQLNDFAGRWKTSGTVFLPDGTMTVQGTDTYEWFPGGFFLVHKVDVLMGTERNETLEMIGYDAADNNYTMHSYDNQGNYGEMRATCDNGNWTFQGATLRFRGGFSEGGQVLSGVWEQLENSAWKKFIAIRLERKADSFETH